MIFYLWQSLTRELLKLRIATVLDLLSKQRCICLLILDLSVHIIAVESLAQFRLERGNHRVISAVQ